MDRISSGLTEEDIKLVQALRLLLYAVYKENPPKTFEDLDILAYRILNVLKDGEALKMYRKVLSTWQLDAKFDKFVSKFEGQA